MTTPLSEAQKSTARFLQGFQQLARFNVDLTPSSFTGAAKKVRIFGTTETSTQKS